MILYGFPYAFGGANIYNELKKYIDRDIEFRTLNYPGHATRIDEKPMRTIKDIVDDIYNNIVNDLNQDYALLGYSMGGVVCYELYQKLKQKNKRLPVYIFALASSEPEFARDQCEYETYQLEDLRKELIKLDGTSESIINNNDIIELLSEVIRSDLIALRDYKPLDSINAKIGCPILIVRGTLEKNSEKCKSGWGKYCESQFEYETIDGKHFFLFDGESGKKQKIASMINSRLKQCKQR